MTTSALLALDPTMDVQAGLIDDINSILLTVRDMIPTAYTVLAGLFLIYIWFRLNIWSALGMAVPVVLLGFLVFNIGSAPTTLSDTIQEARTAHPAGT